jgi:hypothetical protein
MSRVTAILDALLRRGTPMQQRALRLLRNISASKTVLSEQRMRVGPSGVEAFRVTVAPYPITRRAIGQDLAEHLEQMRMEVPAFLRHFGVDTETPWTLEHLDEGFARWLSSPERAGYDDEAVTQILGAAFGAYCIEALQMQWVLLTDQDGTDLAIEGTEHAFRAFPMHSVRKRIRARETGFFVGVFVLTEYQKSVSAEHDAPLLPAEGRE